MNRGLFAFLLFIILVWGSFGSLGLFMSLAQYFRHSTESVGPDGFRNGTTIQKSDPISND